MDIDKRREFSPQEIEAIAARRKAEEEARYPLDRIEVTVDVDSDAEGEPVVRVTRHAQDDAAYRKMLDEK